MPEKTMPEKRMPATPRSSETFRDRRAAGRVLAERLSHYAGRSDVVVLALPRGGVAVAAPVASALHAPLDVLVVRKLGVPGQAELAMGAIAPRGTTVRNEAVLSQVGVTAAAFDAVRAGELVELSRREQAYRDGRAGLPLAGQCVIVVDDGLATGASMRAAILALRHEGLGRVVIAVPVAAAATCARLAGDVDEMICARTPADFVAVGAHYDDFAPTTDDEVRRLLAGAVR